MIETETGYRATLEAIKTLKEANEKTRQKYKDLDKRKLRILLSGSSEIKKMEKEVRDYERRQLRKAS